MWMLGVFLLCTGGLGLTEGKFQGTAVQRCFVLLDEVPPTADCRHLENRQVARDIFDTRVEVIYLSKNPYDCNCGMEWFLRRIHLKDFTQTIKDVMEMTCDTPARLKGRHVYRLTKKDICPPVDECKLKTHKCHKYAECLDREYGYACTCRNGFTGDGKNCVEIDECDIPQSCPAKSVCLNSIGTYSCTCNDGYRMRNSKCRDINECHEDKTKCRRHAKCINIPGSYRCVCEKGYHNYRGKKCVTRDVDECKTMSHPCDPLAECQNTIGSYKCVCPEGYRNSGRKCIDIDECESAEDDCHRDAVCENTAGSYLCSCKSGFKQLKDGRLCMQEDETNLVPIIVGSFFFVVIVIASLAICLYMREGSKRREKIEGRPFAKENPNARNWLPSFMFPKQNMNSVPLREF